MILQHNSIHTKVRAIQKEMVNKLKNIFDYIFGHFCNDIDGVGCIRSSNIHWAYSPSCERSGCCWMLNFGPFSLPPHTSFIFWQIILQLDCWTKKSHHFSGIIALLNHPWLCTLCLRICDRYPHCLGFILFTFSMPRQHHSPRRYNLRGLIEHMFSRRGW